MDFVNFTTVVSVAILSSFSHCVGMCGGFLTLQSLFLRDKNNAEIFLLTAIYHLARIFAYTLLGAIFGAFGGILVFSASSRALLFFIIGILLVLIGAALWLRGGILNFIENGKISKFITQNAIKASKISNIFGFILLGFLNGLLPCGVVYYFAAMAITAASTLKGMLIMLIFGLSTMPAMMSIAVFFRFIDEKFKQIMFKISLVIIISNGIYLTFLGYMANG
ncbi:MAG: sulfite exporter TauE/SafE family protein [Campylobacter sp.]|nr:sulfite exporter TauE/SafE family protein [Campylobacter sp.]